MPKPPLTKDRIIAAYAIAGVADLLEFGITAAENLSLGALVMPAEMVNVALDCVVLGAMTKLIGFHWLFLPSFMVELIPEVAVLPTWVGCVAVVVSKRKREVQTPPRLPEEGKVIEVEIVDTPPKP
jgi:hypothetical protein